MKIAVISLYNFDSSVPLINHLNNSGQDVDLFFMLTISNPNGFVLRIPQNVEPGIYSLIDEFRENSELIQFLNYKKTHRVIILNDNRYKFLIKNMIIFFQLSNYIKNNGYEIIHFIGQSPFFMILYKLLGKFKIVHSLHETLPHNFFENNNTNYRFLDFVIKNSHQIIVHSMTSYQKLKNYNQQSINMTSMIRFGLYESYKQFIPERNTNKCRQILYFGVIRPYKGVHVLLEAFELLAKNFYDLKLVIAGRGDFYFDIQKYSNLNIEIINKELTEQEIVNLVNNATIIVCPYTSASQSGVPMVSYLFNKPIVASKVGGLAEVIKEGKTGFLVEPNDIEQLSSKIKLLLENTDLYNAMVCNIEEIYSSGEYDWNVIASETTQIYKKAQITN